MLAGRRLDYRALAETLPLVDAKGNPTASIFAAFGSAFGAYDAEELGYRTDLPYRVLAREVARDWDRQDVRREGGPGLAMQSLQAALLDHPGMRVLIANGCYDPVTPYLGSLTRRPAGIARCHTRRNPPVPLQGPSHDASARRIAPDPRR
jgi:hypothetical protein